MSGQELIELVKQETEAVRQEGVVAAFSGGCDSVSLLLLLFRLFFK